jgi:hypothetical protein
MDMKKLRKTIGVLAIMLTVCAANSLRVLEHTQGRAVEFVSVLALGMVIGGLIFSIRLYFRMKSKSEREAI